MPQAADFPRQDRGRLTQPELPVDAPLDVGHLVHAVDVGGGLILPEDVAARIRTVLKYVRPERLWINPDCGLFETPRWIGVAKLRAMVAGTKIVRKELGAT